MRRLPAVIAIPVLGLALASCGDDEGSDSGSGSGGASALEQDGDALVSCLDDAGIDAVVDDATPLGVEEPTVGVEVSDLPSELLKFDSGSGTRSGVKLWVFESEDVALEARPYITLADEDDDSNWVAGRVVLDWYYPVNREAEEAVAVEGCVAELEA